MYRTPPPTPINEVEDRNPTRRFLSLLSEDILYAKNKLLEIESMKRFDDLFTSGERCSIKQLIIKLEERSQALTAAKKTFL